MRGATPVTMVAGALLVGLAWAAGALGLLAGHRQVVDVLAEGLALLLVILAWRYRRHRLAVAGVLVAGVNLVIRTGHLAPAGQTGMTAIALSISVDLILLAVTRDRPLWRPVGMLWFAIVALQCWFAVFGIHLVGKQAISLLASPVLTPAALTSAALIGASIVTATVFVVRRGAFEGSLVWVSAACAAALAGWRGPHEAALLFGAAQLALLVGFVEDAYRLAFHDELTGLPGRRALNEVMRELSGEFTIVMVDVDHFKRFNDRHGHDAGDQVLRMVADELSKVGAGGRVYRYGGEEFAIVFPGGVVADLRDRIDELRRSVAERRFALRAPDRPRTKPERPRRSSKPARRVTVTVSMGAANTTSRRTTPGAVLRAADNALYRAKKAGRNRLVAAGDRLA